VKRIGYIATLVAAVVVGAAAPAAAIADGASGGTSSNGVGFCMVYLAPNPTEGTDGEVPFDRLGKAMREIAKYSGAPALLVELRYPSCGGPGAIE
jgi:hypothetical protein